MSADEYSDPVRIPITFTMPDPRPPPRSGRWDLGDAYHPSFGDPAWFRRQGLFRDVSAAADVAERRRSLLGPWPNPGYIPSAEDIRGGIERARRRAQHARKEAEDGDYAGAAGHLLRGVPFPAEVDDPPGPIVRHEETEPPEARSPDLDALAAQAKQDLEKRLADSLDEEHRQAAENDRLGKPVISNGKMFDHEREVAERRQ